MHQAQSLRNAFGGWPPPGFDKLSVIESTEFYKSIKDKQGDDLQIVAKEFLTRVHETGESWNKSGTFQPLGYYEKLGYDINNILELTQPCDKKVHQILGMTYRVNLDSTSTFGRRSDLHGESHSGGGTVAGTENVNRRRQKRMEMICDGPGGAAGSTGGHELAHGGAASAAASIGSDDESDDASPTDSSSSSSDNKKNKKKDKKNKKKADKKKKKKEDKKHSKKDERAKQKAADKEKRDAEKAAEREKKDIISKARTIQTKATPMSLRLCDCIRNPSFPHVPTIFAKQITDAHTMFMTFIEKATIVMNSEGQVAAALPDVKDARFLSTLECNAMWACISLSVTPIADGTAFSVVLFQNLQCISGTAAFSNLSWGMNTQVHMYTLNAAQPLP